MENKYKNLRDYLDPNDPRKERWDTQLKEWGFDETEIWDLTSSLCRFLVPRLKKFREIYKGHTLEEIKNRNGLTIKDLDDMIQGFDTFLEDQDTFEINKALQKFIQHFPDLFL